MRIIIILTFIIPTTIIVIISLLFRVIPALLRLTSRSFPGFVPGLDLRAKKPSSSNSQQIFSLEDFLSPQPAGSGYGPQRLAESAPADFEGIVSALEKRSEQEFAWTTQGQNQSSLIIWTFRVTRRDPHGYELPPPIPIEICGHHIHGLLENGDRVKVPRSWRAGQMVSVDRVYNQTTCSWVHVTWEKDYGTLIIGFIFIFLSVIACFMLHVSFIICMVFFVVGIIIALASPFGSRRRRSR